MNRWYRGISMVLWPLPLPLLAQTPAVTPVVPSRAVTIAAAEVARQLHVLTADSFRQPTTPSLGLERTATYVAAEFRRLGLEPSEWNAGAATPWIQRYSLPIPLRVGYTTSSLLFYVHVGRSGRAVFGAAGEPLRKRVTLPFAAAAYFAPEISHQTVARNAFAPGSGGVGGEQNPFAFGQPVAVVAGRQTVATVRQVADRLRDKAVVYVPAADADTATQNQILATLYVVSQGVIGVSTADSMHFRARHTAQQTQPTTMIDAVVQTTPRLRRWSYAVWVWASAIQQMLGAAGEDLAQLRVTSMPVVRELPSVVALLVVNAAAETGQNRVAAPNVVGVLEGTDTFPLSSQYVVISTAMDIPGHGNDVAPRSAADSSDPEKNTVDVASLLALAEAFAPPAMRPRRSLVFLATSGQTQDFAGAQAFTDLWRPQSGARLVTQVALEFSGRSTGDSLIIDGMHDVELPFSPTWMAAAHPEFTMAIADGGTVVRPGTAAFPFVTKRVPSLRVHLEGSADDPNLSAMDTTAYVVRSASLLVEIIRRIADADRPLQWSPEGRRQFQAVLGP